MKHFTQLTVALAFMGAINANAQTDVTSTYLTNADFSSGAAIDNHLCGYSHDMEKNGTTYYGLQEVSGWNIETLATATGNDGQEGCGVAGAVFAYGSSFELKGNNKTAPEAGPDGGNGQGLGFFAVWGNGGYYYQEAILPAGTYTITVPTYNASGTQANTSYIGFVADGGASYTTSTNPTVGAWTNLEVTFNLTEETSGRICVGYKSTGSGSGANPHLFFDGVNISYQAGNAVLDANTEKVADASVDNPIVTDFVVNGTFDSNVAGWSRTGGFQNNKTANNQQGDFTGNFYENWHSSAGANKMYQVIENIPNGTYKLRIAAFVNNFAGDDTQFVFANDDKTYLTTGAPTFYDVFTVVTDNKIEIGLEQIDPAIANWMGIDNVKLTYFGEGDVIAQAQASAYRANYLEALAAAEDALADEANQNISGSELATLNALVGKSEPSTASGYESATADLKEATQTFIAARGAYNAFAAAKDLEQEQLPYASTSKYNTFTSLQSGSPNDAEDAQERTNDIYAALRAYVESNAMAESETGATDFTDRIINPIAAEGTSGWTLSGVITRGGEGYTDADGVKAETYFDSDVWGISSATATMKQDIELEAGKYLLSVTARASSDWDTFTLNANDESVEMQRIGNQGNVFGNGWNDQFVEFETDGSAPVTISVSATTTTAHQWFSVDRFRLVQLEKVIVDMADASDYEQLNTLIDEAEENTIGFDANEYAPYNNVEALVALEKAKAIDQTQDNTKKAVQSAIDALTAAEWTANDGAVDYLYNGDFAIVEDGANYPKGWKRPNTWGQMRTEVEGADNGTAYYNQPGSLVYGDRTGYTLPLKAGQYDFSCKYRSHEDNSNTGLTITLLNKDTAEELAQSFDGNPSTSEFETAEWTLQIEENGNYVLTIGNGGNTWITDVKLVKHSDVPDSISTINSNQAQDNAIFNLAGQRVEKAQKGIYIQNGRKIIVK